ncbi:MAG: hypothetical protein R3A13_02775 [Bdellovibrionota bacterium]
MIIRLFISITILFSITAGVATADDIFVPREVQESLRKKLAKKEKQEKEEAQLEKPYKRFGKFIADLREVCVLMHFDGRRKALLAMAEEHSVVDPKCSSCKNFFKTLKTACNDTARFKQAVKIEYLSLYPPKPTPTPDPEEEVDQDESEEDADHEASSKKLEPFEMEFQKQYEPRPVITALLVRIFSEMARDTGEMDSLLPAIEKFKAVLNDPQGKTKSEHAYFSNLSVYAYMPFKKFSKIKQIRERQDKARLEEQKKKMSVDDLFDFE